LKFLHNGIVVSDKAPRQITKTYPEMGPCMFFVISVILDKFKSDHEHWINSLEDNWIPKEFMQVAFDEILYELTPTDKPVAVESDNKLIKNKITNMTFNQAAKGTTDDSDFLSEMKEQIGK
jgi:hypothetical protein